MTRYLLDTNIVSNVTKIRPSSQLIAWLNEQDDFDLFISTIAVAEIWRGILEAPEGRRRRSLEDWFAGTNGPTVLFAGRVLPFDERAALIWARLMVEGARQGRPRSSMDMMVAAIAEANDCLVVTDNEKDFAPAVQILNPIRS